MFNKALIIGILLVGPTFTVSATEVQKWEYKCVGTDGERVERELRRVLQPMIEGSAPYVSTTAADIIAKRFNQLGEEGWEMVGYAMNDGGNARMVCFKRPKKS